MEIPYQQLWEMVMGQIHGSAQSIHGPEHWKRVERNGMILAKHSGADLDVVRLFALFHDSRRINDGWDPGHGVRGAAFASELQGTFFHLSTDQFDKLHYACSWHTDEVHHADPTIGTCWDADRLDLGRVGMIPNAKYLNTAYARQHCADWRGKLPQSR